MTLPTFGQSEDPAHLHQHVLLNAIHTAQPVLCAGRAGFIQALYPTLAGGRVEMIVYLTGDSTPHNASEIQLQEQPK